MFYCMDCSAGFTRSDNLRRHVMNSHYFIQKNSPGGVGVGGGGVVGGVGVGGGGGVVEGGGVGVGGGGGGGGGVGGGGSFQFRHPFTMVVSGPSFCGKTHLVKTLLQANDTMITPTPERIIWLYRRWQPMYDVIKETVHPPVEFVQGIPYNLEQDGYLNVLKRNLIVLDDLMSTSSKDSRITELFTEGSHHRNLSVIALNQNLYYSKDPTQRRNCHYLTLFNSPIDRQQIMTLAKQMYPDSPQYFMHSFQEAVSQPYGHLLVDLKPTTPEALRLRPNVLPAQKRIRDQPVSDLTQIVYDREQDIRTSPYNDTEDQDPFANMPNCDDCGLVFATISDLHRHIKMWCVAKPTIKRKWDDDSDDGEYIPNSKKRWMSLNCDLSIKKDQRNEHRVYCTLADMAMKENGPQFSKKMKKYVEEKGMTNDDARSKAEAKLREFDLNRFLQKYGTLLEQFMRLQHGPLHKKIMDTVYDSMDDGNGKTKAIRMALRAHRHELEEFLDSDEDDSDQDEKDSDQDEEDSDQDEEDSDQGEEDSDEDSD